MSGASPWLLGYLLSEPECVRYLGTMMAGILCAAAAGMAWLSFSGGIDAELYDLDMLALPVRTYHYSAHAEVQAYDGLAEFVRSGACVGRIREGALGISWSGDKSDWVLSVEYEDGTTDRFSCGPAGWQEIRRAGRVAMRFAGRHAYG